MSTKFNENPYFSNPTRPIYEIYQLLPEFRLESSKDDELHFTGEPEVLTALTKHIDNANDTVIHGLQSFFEILIEHASNDDFSISAYDFQNLLSWMSLNVNLLETNLEVKDNIACEKKMRGKI